MRLFEVALNEFENLEIGGIDVLAHKTISDLWWLVRHELDLNEEGEDNDLSTGRQIILAKTFLHKWAACKGTERL